MDPPNRFAKVVVLVLCWIALVDNGYCVSKQNHTLLQYRQESVTTASNLPEYYDANVLHVTATFMYRLNELITNLAMFASDESLNTGEALNRTENEWNRTNRVLAGLVKSEVGRNSSMATSLRNALAAIREEKSKFDIKSRITENNESYDYHGAESFSANAVNPVSLILRPTIAGLTQVSTDLLRSMRTNGRATTTTEPSIDQFLLGFRRRIKETRRIITVEAKQTLVRVKSRLSVLPDPNDDIATYLRGYTQIIWTFIKTVSASLGEALGGVLTSIRTDGAQIVDAQLSTGLTQLFKKAAKIGNSPYLENCLTRYVYQYVDQSHAKAKILACGQPEISFLEYLIRLTAVFLQRAVISDSSAAKMSVICSMGSTDCMGNFYDSLTDQQVAAEMRFETFANLTQLELDAMVQRVAVCSNATVSEVQTFAKNTKKSFNQCLMSGKIN